MSYIAAAGLAVSAGGTIFSAFKSAKANKANEKILNEQTEANEASYNLDRNYMESNEAKSVLERARKRSQDNNKVIDNNKAITGGTAEATIAAKAKNNEGYNNTVRNLAEVGSRHATMAKQTYNNNLNRLTSMKMGMNQQSGQSAANVAGNAGDLVSTAALLSAFNNKED